MYWIILRYSQRFFFYFEDISIKPNVKMGSKYMNGFKTKHEITDLTTGGDNFKVTILKPPLRAWI